jgi:hypothetical protein
MSMTPNEIVGFIGIIGLAFVSGIIGGMDISLWCMRDPKRRAADLFPRRVDEEFSRTRPNFGKLMKIQNILH